ncbi:MFS transporter [Streptomyces sp. BBFR2]|uniref:MFS transporter n=1 Tax=Streptomyces sp. BBFR2 TaxID=3372854 RepID=UPI0037D9FF64
MGLAPSAARSRAGLLTAAGIVLIAVNLRPAVATAAALLERLRAELGFGPLVASLVPALPTLCFAAVGATGAALARRAGTERAVLLALAALVAGLAVRAVPSTGALLAGTVLSAAGLALCNVLLPALVKAHFPGRVALLTGVYTTVMALGSALAAAVAVPVADLAGGPSPGLAVWALPALLALAVWALAPGSVRAGPEQERQRERRRGGTGPGPRDGAGEPGPQDGAAGPAAERGAGPAPERAAVSAWAVGRTRFGLLVTAFFALQSLASYAVIGWLPTVLTDHGVPADRAGSLLGTALLVGVPAAFVLLPLTRSPARLRLAFCLVGAALTAGYLGLLYAPSAAAPLWAVLTGLGLCAFPLVLALIGTSGRSARETAALSSFAQSTGYLLASAGPFGVGLLRSATGGWSAPLTLLLTLGVLQLLVGLALTSRWAAGR